jgi:hypothetical protein
MEYNIRDIESGDFEIDRDDFTAMQRLRARRSDAQIWLMRAGRPTAYQIGWRPAPGESELRRQAEIDNGRSD